MPASSELRRSGTPPGSGIPGTARFSGAKPWFVSSRLPETSGCRARFRALGRAPKANRQRAGTGTGGAHGAVARSRRRGCPAAAPSPSGTAFAAENGFAYDLGGACTWGSLAAVWGCTLGSLQVGQSVREEGTPGHQGAVGREGTRDLPGGRTGGVCSGFPERAGRNYTKAFYRAAGSTEINHTYFHLEKSGYQIAGKSMDRTNVPLTCSKRPR